jgi:hypothetical protein
MQTHSESFSKTQRKTHTRLGWTHVFFEHMLVFRDDARWYGPTPLQKKQEVDLSVETWTTSIQKNLTAPSEQRTCSQVGKKNQSSENKAWKTKNNTKTVIIPQVVIISNILCNKKHYPIQKNTVTNMRKSWITLSNLYDPKFNP